MSEKQWRERWRRQDEASDRLGLLSPDSSDLEIAEAVADFLIAHGLHRRKWLLSVLNVRDDRPVESDWHYKNVWGVTTMDEGRARRWIIDCMLLGYSVFYSWTKHGSGGGQGSIGDIRKRMSLAWSRPTSAALQGSE